MLLNAYQVFSPSFPKIIYLISGLIGQQQMKVVHSLLLIFMIPPPPHLPFVLHLQSGILRRWVSALEWRDQEGVYRCKRLKISRGGGGDGLGTEACNYGKFRLWRATSGDVWALACVKMWRCMDFKMGCTVLNSLKFAYRGLRETIQERVAIVNVWKNKRNNKKFDCIINEVVVNSTDMQIFKKAFLQMKLMCFFIESSFFR